MLQVEWELCVKGEVALGKKKELWASLMAQRLKQMPAMWETWVQSLGREVPLEKEMATHSSIIAWRIPRTEEPGVTNSQTRLSDFTFHFLFQQYSRFM